MLFRLGHRCADTCGVTSVSLIPEAREGQRVTTKLLYLPTPIAIAAVWWLRSRGLLADTPLVAFVVALVACALANVSTAFWLDAQPSSRLRIHARIAAAILGSGVVIYAAGWGSLLAIAYALSAAEVLRTIGTDSTVPVMYWTLVAVLLGETAVQFGLAPSMVGTGLSHAVALTGTACLMVVTKVLGDASRAAELAEAKVRERGRHFESLIERASDVIGVISATGTIRSINPAIEGLLGYRAEEVIGRQLAYLVGDEREETALETFRQVVSQRTLPCVVETEFIHRDGSTRLAIATVSSPSEEWGTDVIINIHDVTNQRVLEGKLREDAVRDALTGLLNRRAFAEASEQAAARAVRHGTTVGILFVDLDGFKHVNDSLGHVAGDFVLVETARRLSACVPGGETVARLGGDEFAILFEAVEDHLDTVRVAERIISELRQPIHAPEGDAWIGASVGIALRTAHDVEMTNLLRLADEAMYAAKRNGRSRWELAAA